MQTIWHMFTNEIPDAAPCENQDIFCCIAEGEGRPVTEIRRTKADLCTFKHLLARHPHWCILWTPVIPLALPHCYHFTEGG